MADMSYFKTEEYRQHLKDVAEALREATRIALLEHARMGRSIPERGPNNTVVWVPPEEIFRYYGFDEFGRPLPGAGDSGETKENP